MRGRSSATSAISIRPANSGKNRSRAVSRSAASAGSASSPSATSEKLTEPEGNSDTATLPRNSRSSPVTLRISALTASRTLSAGISNVIVPSTAKLPSTTTAIAMARRLKPVAAVTGCSNGSA